MCVCVCVCVCVCYSYGYGYGSLFNLGRPLAKKATTLGTQCVCVCVNSETLVNCK